MRNVLVVLLLTFALTASAQTDGHWSGAIQLPTGKLDVQVDLASGKGDISIPAQGARDLPLEAIAIDGAKVSFRISGVPGAPTFHGTVDGAKLSGTFTQGGQTFPFELTRGAAEDPSAPLAGIETMINDALGPWDVPGLAVAVIADNRVVWAKGFGKRNVAKNLPMTADTLLPIGSITKSFTTSLMGMLVDEGKLSWDEPVQRTMPEFRASDSVLSVRLTPRDLVTHRTGLPRHDLVWYNDQSMTRGDLVARLAHLPVSEDLRARYQYNNLMFLAAGHLVEEVTKQPWEDVVRARLFTPLGMTRSNFENAQSARDADHARGYREDHGKILELPFREVGNMGPVGSISSSANELARYALLHLNRGKYNGKQLLQPTTVREMHTPLVAVGTIPDQPEIGPRSYGLGWFVDSYRGHYRVSHGGNIDGFSALLTMFPNSGVAVVALSNANGTALPSVVTSHIADRMLKLPAKDWNGEALARRASARAVDLDAESKRTATRKPGTKPSHPIADYAGDYASDGYGTLRIESAGGDKLQVTYNRIVTPLEHWHYDVWNGAKNEADPTFENMKYLFRGDLAGNVSSVEALFEPRVGPIVFRKKPDAKLTDPAHLSQFLGNYTLGPQKIVVSLRGNRLVMNVASQPPYDLEPDIDGWFNLKGLTGFRARFSPGKVELSQPNGLYTATKDQP
ncbi:MAG TPA: serine hydrolase [Thermoanaerobaculia bacterium]|jgi:CubicO group peptidase (beta-lactamase class C family)